MLRMYVNECLCVFIYCKFNRSDFPLVISFRWLMLNFKHSLIKSKSLQPPSRFRVPLELCLNLLLTPQDTPYLNKLDEN